MKTIPATQTDATTWGWYQPMVDWHTKFKEIFGRSPNQNEWLNAFQETTGASPEAALSMYQRGSEYIRTQGGGIADEITQNQWMRDLGQRNPGEVPLPHQINPAVWDSMSETARQMFLASAEKGRTPGGVYTPDMYLAQIEAARPKGRAIRQTNFNWGRQKPLF